MKRKINYNPHLPAREINKLVKELSNPRLIPSAYSPILAKQLTTKVTKIVNDLMLDYNHKVVEIITKERESAFKEGIKEGRKYAKK
jgi:hypothetical protein